MGASLQWVPLLVSASVQWVPVFSGCESLVGASLQWARDFSGCKFSSLTKASGIENRLSQIWSGTPKIATFSKKSEKVKFHTNFELKHRAWRQEADVPDSWMHRFSNSDWICCDLIYQRVGCEHSSLRPNGRFSMPLAFELSARLQWVRVFSGSQSSVDASLQCVRVFSGSEFQWEQSITHDALGCQTNKP
jgi:hypothetical protein